MHSIVVYSTIFALCVQWAICGTFEDNKIDAKKQDNPTPCTCGIFLSGQFVKGSSDPPKGNPVLLQETDTHFSNGNVGNRMCMTKCLEIMIKHLPKSEGIICSSIERDCSKEKAYLFVQNYNDSWINSKMSAGKEYCCKDNSPYKCPAS